MDREALTQALQPLGGGSGRALAFLLGALQEKSLKVYSSALCSFRDYPRDAGVRWSTLSTEAKDDVLADYVLDQHDAGVGRQKMTVLVAALHKIHRERDSRLRRQYC